jgi:ABC-type lipoprotein export system ATPase subunit
MSSSQRKKVSIAKALVKKTKIILADEPTYSLDFAACREVLSLIEKFVNEGITTVVVTTRSEEVARMADRVIRIKDGKIVEIQ